MVRALRQVVSRLLQRDALPDVRWHTAIGGASRSSI
jgi:hypothetical protein